MLVPSQCIYTEQWVTRLWTILPDRGHKMLQTRAVSHESHTNTCMHNYQVHETEHSSASRVVDEPEHLEG